jgi:REP element-mobilizing transposase RayT
MQNESQHPEVYCVTATICGRKPLFAEDQFISLILKSLEFQKSRNRIKLYAYVIMPTHLHIIVQPVDRTIAKFEQDFGSSASHEIVNHLIHTDRKDLLQFFAENSVDRRHSFRIWNDIAHKPVLSESTLREELETLHNNPVKPNWHLVEDRDEYPYSSAKFYDLGVSGLLKVDDVRELWG